jgi:hypothetical protein
MDQPRRRWLRSPGRPARGLRSATAPAARATWLLAALLLLGATAGWADAAPAPATAPTPAAPAAVSVPTFESGKSPERELHVALSGNDSTGTGAPDRPFRTVRRAAQAATPGTAVRIGPGTYTEGTFIDGLRGTAERPIWIGGVPGQPRPVITGVGEALHLSRVHYLVVHDLVVRGATANGINADDGGEVANPDATRNLVFRDLDIAEIGGTGNQDCLKLSGVNDYFVLNSRFRACGGAGSGSGIDHVGCSGGLIAGNLFQDMSANAVQSKGGSADIEIRANRMLNAGPRAVNIGGSTGYEFFRPPLSTTAPNAEARNIRVIANVIVGSQTPFAFVGAVDSLAANNTVIEPTTWLLRILQETVSDGTYSFLPSGNNRVVNNLFVFRRAAVAVDVNVGPNTAAGTFRFANNLWYASDNPARSAPALPAAEQNGVVGRDPLLRDLAAGDYRLRPGSAALGAGALLPEVVADFDGAPYRQPPSIGAHEAPPAQTPRSYRAFLPLARR